MRPRVNFVSSFTGAFRLQDVECCTRLCPLQVLGKQATSTSYKARAALRMLALEADDVNVARSRVYSLLSDMGVESGLWTLPSLCPDDRDHAESRCFPNSIPLGDFDHSLHHVMLASQENFKKDNALWAKFDQQLHAISKFFSKGDCAERYVKKNILDNQRIPSYVKSGLASMFKTKCPTYVATRWHYAFEVLHWVSSRKQLLEFIEPASVRAGEETEISVGEAAAFKDLSDPAERVRFWACFWAFYIIQAWGFNIQTWTHKCPCEESHGDGCCNMRGRRLIELADGKCDEFLRDLQGLLIEARPEAAKALQELEKLDAAEAGMLRNCFLMGKRGTEVRFRQSTSFYTTFPWNLPKLLSYILLPCESRDMGIRESQKFAMSLVADFDGGLLQTNTYADKFFAGELGQALRAWGLGNVTVMGEKLFHELLRYSLSLIVMQRLESRHHLVGMKISAGRANAAATASAMLRRRLNDDSKQEAFAESFEDYLQQFERLVPESWNSMKELHRLISGHHLEVMFRDVTFEDQLIASAVKPRPTSGTVLEYLSHLKAVLHEGDYYAFPTAVNELGETTYALVQIVTFSPSSKKYMQRIVCWGTDAWYERIGVASFGLLKAVPDCISLEDNGTLPCPLPADVIQEVAAGQIESLPADAFFQYGFENVFRFKDVVTTCELSVEAIQACAGEDEEEFAVEDSFVQPQAKTTVAALTSTGQMLLGPMSFSLQHPLDLLYTSKRLSKIGSSTGSTRSSSTSSGSSRKSRSKDVEVEVVVAYQLRTKILEIGRTAAAAGKPIPVAKKYVAAADWLVQHELASMTADNELVLLSNCLQTKSVLSSLELVRDPADDTLNSTWGLRSKLTKQGWVQAQASECSAAEKRFCKTNSMKFYYCLLLQSSLVFIR